MVSVFRDGPPYTKTPIDPRDTLMTTRVRKRGEKGRIGLFGVPFDGAVLGRRGCAEGPASIRAELAALKPYSFGRGEFDPGIVDWGDVDVPPDDVAGAHARVEAAAREVLAAGQFPLALGGDHSITYALLRAHVEGGRRERVGVINLDAHLDVREVRDGRPNSGTSFGRLLEEGLVAPENLVEVGLRDFANSPYYGAKAEKLGVSVVTALEAREEGLAEVMEDAIRRASRRAKGVYLSVDMDVLDHAHGPGVSAPTPGGFTSAELLEAVRVAARSGKLLGADVVEVAPPYDVENRTSRAAAFTVMTLLAGLSEETARYG